MKKFLTIFFVLALCILTANAITAPQERDPFATPENFLKSKPKKEIRYKKDVEDIITEGKGVWVNVWNYPKNIEAFINRLRKFKIDTVYLQINRSTTEVFKHKRQLDAILKAAHKRDIKIIGWTYCYLRNIDSDVNKYVEPALYVSPHGEKLDGMAADIEENTALWAVKTYTRKIKDKLPDDYPLIAIVFSPKIKSHYPWQYIAKRWDILMPMTYWHGLRKRDNDIVYNFVKDSISDLKRLTKKDDIKIHLITDGDSTNEDEVKISLRAAKDMGINAGISIYPEHLASDKMLEEIKRF